MNAIQAGDRVVSGEPFFAVPVQDLVHRALACLAEADRRPRSPEQRTCAYSHSPAVSTKLAVTRATTSGLNEPPATGPECTAKTSTHRDGPPLPASRLAKTAFPLRA